MELRDGDAKRPSRQSDRRLGRRARRLFIAAVMLGLLSGGAIVGRETILQTAAKLWIVSDPIGTADVAVVLGGGLDVRPFEAADLYRKGLVRKVLVSQVDDDRAARIGASPGHTEANRRVLLLEGVPAEAIETFGVSNTSTQDEALALKRWVDRHEVTKISIPTEIFSARRVRWTMKRALTGTAARVSVLSFDPPQYTRRDWWKSSSGAFAFPSEVVKYFVYRLRY
ncbi:hypothetical protein RHPLAN_53340 [Rhodoplanes sp. Z2-YC6860]|nr:YdcF family protein [Rhodoplanes sp. Z2-YC6860]AMN43751.1 hypothetical protein RHPLAN_53340 [Rhodoplanes sp. Z2-YC6860]